MYKNKAKNGKLNISGEQIKMRRKELHISQRALADRLQLLGIDLNKNAIQRIESGQRFVTDIELQVIAKLFDTTTDSLLKEQE